MFVDTFAPTLDDSKFAEFARDMVGACETVNFPLSDKNLIRLAEIANTQNSLIAQQAKDVLEKSRKYYQNRRLAYQEMVKRIPSLSAPKSIAPDEYSSRDIEKIISTTTDQLNIIGSELTRNQKHVDNPSQNELRKGIGPFAIGTALLAFPNVTGIIESSFRPDENTKTSDDIPKK